MFLVDSNVVVYRFDTAFPGKQAAAEALIRAGIASGELRLPYQALVESMAALTRPRRDGSPAILPADAAARELEELSLSATVLYPDERVFHTALRGALAYQLPWFDALVWAVADRHGIPTLYTEDFGAGRIYGRTRVVNPFAPSPTR